MLDNWWRVRGMLWLKHPLCKQATHSQQPSLTDKPVELYRKGWVGNGQALPQHHSRLTAQPRHTALTIPIPGHSSPTNTTACQPHRHWQPGWEKTNMGCSQNNPLAAVVDQGACTKGGRHQGEMFVGRQAGSLELFSGALLWGGL